jgi:hypothetical protein
MAKVLSSDQLVETSLRRAMIPSDQTTFTSADIRSIMNEEMSTYIVPLVLKAHEEYYVIDEDIAIENNKVRYEIPYRAVGNKLRDAQYIDNAGSQYEMTRVTVEDRPDYQGNYSNNQYLTFYFQGNNVVLMQNQLASGSIRMSYYLRPNDLVEVSRGAVISAISTELANATITSYANLVSGTADTITVAGITFIAQVGAATLGDATFQAATSNADTATSLATQINAHATTSAVVSATASDAVVTVTALTSSYDFESFSYTDNDGNIGMTVTDILKVFTIDNIPAHFATTSIYDIVQKKSPNQIKVFDIDIVSLDSTLQQITFKKDDLVQTDMFSITPKKVEFEVGDVILQAEETIYAQIPTELQAILAQRTAVKLLEAMGDTEGKRNAVEELQRMEQNSSTLIYNRAEGAPKKITNRHSLLKSGLSNNRYRR